MTIITLKVFVADGIIFGLETKHTKTWIEWVLLRKHWILGLDGLMITLILPKPKFSSKEFLHHITSEYVLYTIFLFILPIWAPPYVDLNPMLILWTSGSLWNEWNAKSCLQQKVPVFGSTYPGGLPPALGVLKKVLNTIKKPVKLLDITNLSLLRKDGHPSMYGLGGPTGMDCSHWCLPGVPDTWNQLLYNLIITNQD